jgi:hypothetical protein
MPPPAASLASVKVFMNGPSPTLIGPLVSRRHSIAPPPPTSAGAILQFRAQADERMVDALRGHANHPLKSRSAGSTACRPARL